MSSFRAIARTASLVVMGTLAFTACASDAGDPFSPTTPQLELVSVTTTVAVPAEEFAVADENGNAVTCVKQTPSGQLLYKDDNPATPSQPCPPSYQVVGKVGSTIKVDKTWFTEDKNENGVVCVKLLDNGKEIVKDDNAATPSQPCPPSFNLVGNAKTGKVKLPFDDMVAADDNANDTVCLKTLETTSAFIVHDDNLATPSQPCPPSFAVVSLKAAPPPKDPNVPTPAEPAAPGT